MSAGATSGTKKVHTYCYQCVAGPDLLSVTVEDGVATMVEPDFAAAQVHPAGGKVCVKAYGLIQKAYNPNRIKTPMKRTNPLKGKTDDPGFVPISWDEALDMIADKLKKTRAKGLIDESGYPRVAASFGGGGTPTSYMGTFPAFLGAWGPVDMSFGSGQGVKCTHSEHFYGEFWHRAFTVASDTPLTEYVLSFGANVEASGGVCGVHRHAEARARGIKRVQIEPHLSITGACSAEWIPIRPKTDPAFMFSLIHVMLHECEPERLDLDYLKNITSSPYLTSPSGFYLRDPESQEPLVWDQKTGTAVRHDTPDIDVLLDGEVTASGMVIGADEETWTHDEITVKTTFRQLADHVATYTPEWAAKICDVPAESVRRLANEYLDHAHIGETIEIEGEAMPFRPVAVTLGKTVNNGWGGYECCWARTLLACLVGALEVPGGTIGTTVRLNRPATDRWASIQPGNDGFMDYPMNPTSKADWIERPNVRSFHRTLVPMSANSAWSQALGPSHLAWMMQDKSPEQMPAATPPDIWFVYRTNPAISAWDSDFISKMIAKFPFTVCFAYTMDETNHAADVLLPDCSDLEGLQLIRIGGSKYIEQFWDHQGAALRDPAAVPQNDSRDFTWISTEIARRSGLLVEYNRKINGGAAGFRLSGENYDFRLAEDEVHDVETIWDAECRAASAEITDGKETGGLDYYREHGHRVKPYSRKMWYLYPHMVEKKLRFELPYQERLFRSGQELGNRLHEQGIKWWDTQIAEYETMPHWRDLPGMWETVLAENFNVDIEDYPFWGITSRSMQYSWGGNVTIQIMREVASNIAGHAGVIMNASRAAEMGIEDGDLIELASPSNSTKGKVYLRQGIRPDTLLMIGQFNHWATPFAKDFDVPSLNKLVPMLLQLTDSTGSGADLTRIKIRKLGSAA